MGGGSIGRGPDLGLAEDHVVAFLTLLNTNPIAMHARLHGLFTFWIYMLRLVFLNSALFEINVSTRLAPLGGVVSSTLGGRRLSWNCFDASCERLLRVAAEATCTKLNGRV